MRLKKAEREEYLNTVKAYKSQKVIPIEKDDSVDYALFMLSKDHFSKLTLDLRHIGDIPLSDLLNIDTGEPLQAEDYIHEYTDHELDIVANLIDRAGKGLYYLNEILLKELTKRAKEKERLVNRLKSKMQKEQTKGTNQKEIR